MPRRGSLRRPFHLHAVDNSSGTWWEPSPTDAQPAPTSDLGPATRFDVVQLFAVDSVRLLVRLTMVNWPRTRPLGIIELTVFGRPAGSLPAAQAVPGAR